MASSDSTISIRATVHLKQYVWPKAQLNFWILIMSVAACTMLGIFASFVTIQNQLAIGVPWYFSYWIAVGTLTIIFMFLIFYLLYQRSMVPGIVIMGSFILFVLWLVGLIVISIELFGPTGSVNTNCNIYVMAQNTVGPSQATLAWLEQHSICQSWQAGFAFALVGTIFLLWMMIMAYKVHQ